MALVRYNSVFVPLCSLNTCKDVFSSNVATFQSNCAKGLHFSAFHLQSNSLIVMDNAPYHSRMLESVPTMSSRKQQMHDWLTAKGIEYPESEYSVSALKRELFQLIHASNPKPKFVVDEMAKAVGHEVVWLPPYHCKLNPIELAWSQVNILKIIIRYLR